MAVAASTSASATAAVVSSRARLHGLDWLRFLAIGAVVLIHTSDVALRKNQYFPTNSLEGIAYYCLNACLRFCIPAFFLMSGCLVEARYLRTNEPPESRWRRYAFPLLVCTLFYAVFATAEAHALHKPVTARGLVVSALLGQGYFHLWYLYNALIYCLLHGRLRLLAGRRTFPVIAAIYLAAFVVPSGRMPGFLYTSQIGVAASMLVLAAVYYVGGIWLAHSAQSLDAAPRWCGPALVATGVLLSCLYGAGLHERTFFNPGAAVLAAGLLVVAMRVRRSPPPAVAAIGALSLGIYLWHPVPLLLVRVAEGRYYKQNISPGVTLAVMLLETAVAFGGGLLIALALDRFPRLRPLAR